LPELWHTLCKFLDGKALFTGLFHVYAVIYKEMRDSLQPSIRESEEEDASQVEQTNAERGTETLKMSAT
jgi:hypothetical protein